MNRSRRSVLLVINVFVIIIAGHAFLSDMAWSWKGSVGHAELAINEGFAAAEADGVTLHPGQQDKLFSALMTPVAEVGYIPVNSWWVNLAAVGLLLLSTVLLLWPAKKARGASSPSA